MTEKYLEIFPPDGASVAPLQVQVASGAEAMAQQAALLTGDYAGGTAYFHICRNDEQRPCLRLLLE